MAEAVEVSLPGIGDARLVRRGDYSTLYTGRQLRFNRKVAIKMFSGRAIGPEAMSRFESECAAMGSLSSHPNVVTVFASGIAKKRPYIVTEWLPLGSLHDRLVGGHQFDSGEALDIGVKLAGALESAHRANVLHRNLKPQNVFLSPFSEPLLGDFEISPGQPLAGSRSGDARETQVHAAPELFRGGAPSVASDLYSLASIVFTLLRRLPPFVEDEEEPMVRVVARQAKEPPPDLRTGGVAPALAAVLEWSLAASIDDRPATALELGRLFQAAQKASGHPMTRMFLLPETDHDRALPSPILPAGRAGVAGRPVVEPRVRAVRARATSTLRPAVPGLPLIEQVRGLLRDAVVAYRGRPSADRLAIVQARIDEPLRVAIAGRVKAGKSTLLNALVGENLSPTDAGECTKVVLWYTDSHTYRATLHPRNAEPRQTSFSRSSGAVEVDLGGFTAADIDHITIEWPSSSLASMTLIDTPGIASISEDVSERTHHFLTSTEERDSPADAVVYLMRHVHTSDVTFLETFHDDGVTHPNPINAIGVLSRADELGAGRPDALESAARIAARYRSDPRIRRLCQTVVPVAGLLAETGATLREDEYRALARLSALPATSIEELLVSADRFAGASLEGLTSDQQQQLLDRFGIYGLRLAIGLLQAGEVSTAGQLSAEMLRRSGLEQLRDVLMSQFAARRDVLKARATLLALAAVLREDPAPGTEDLAFMLERIEASAHEFAEIRLLAAHRSGSVTFRPTEAEEVDRLLGIEGLTPAARLGLDPHADAAEITKVLGETIARWQRRAESPMSSRAQVDAAHVLIRTCEGMLVSLAPAE